MLNSVIELFKTAAIAYRAITPMSQLLIRGFSATGLGLFCIILPEVLAAFDVYVVDWKDRTLAYFGCLFIGTGITFGFLPQTFPLAKAYKILREHGVLDGEPEDAAHPKPHPRQNSV